MLYELVDVDSGSMAAQRCDATEQIWKSDSVNSQSHNVAPAVQLEPGNTIAVHRREHVHRYGYGDATRGSIVPFRGRACVSSSTRGADKRYIRSICHFKDRVAYHY